MKVYIIFILLFFSLYSCLNDRKKQTGRSLNQLPVTLYKPLTAYNNDTISYIRENFLKNKNFYINKNLGVLLSKIEVPVTNYTISLGGDDGLHCNGITLKVTNPADIDHRIKKKEESGVLNIDFKESFPMDEITPLTKKNKGAWTIEEKNFFSPKVIKHIGTVHFK